MLKVGAQMQPSLKLKGEKVGYKKWNNKKINLNNLKNSFKLIKKILIIPG